MDDVSDINTRGGSIPPTQPGKIGPESQTGTGSPMGSDGGQSFSSLMNEPAPGKTQGASESPMALFQQTSNKAAATPESYATQANDAANRLQQLADAVNQQPNLDLSQQLSPEDQQNLQKSLLSLHAQLQKASKPVGLTYEPPATSSDMMSAVKKFVGSLESAQQQFRNIGDTVNKQGNNMNPSALLQSLNNAKMASVQIQYMVGILSQSVGGIKSLMSVQL